jgi:DNA-binding CsgD family transcriptional regulator
MSDLSQLFREYCNSKIRPFTTLLPQDAKDAIVQELRASPFVGVVQAWSVLDFQNYEHLAAEGFDTYFGYPNASVTSDKILEMVHPEDQEAFGKLYYLCLEGLLNMPIPTKGIGHFCISYRLRDHSGRYHKITETNNILACDADNHYPLINLAQITLSPEQKQTSKVAYYFKIKDELGSVDIMRAFLSHYDSKINLFTENELKIARLLKTGLTSQKIADTIFLSKHTIDKYRKNMLEKTQCLNTPQLLDYLGNLNLI